MCGFALHRRCGIGITGNGCRRARQAAMRQNFPDCCGLEVGTGECLLLLARCSHCAPQGRWATTSSIVRRLQSLGVPPEDVVIVLDVNDVPHDLGPPSLVPLPLPLAGEVPALPNWYP